MKATKNEPGFCKFCGCTLEMTRPDPQHIQYRCDCCLREWSLTLKNGYLTSVTVRQPSQR